MSVLCVLTHSSSVCCFNKSLNHRRRDPPSRCLSQDFPLLRLEDVVGDQSNILGFSMLNVSHPFYLEFIRSLNLSWKEGCNVSPYPGAAVGLAPSHVNNMSVTLRGTDINIHTGSSHPSPILRFTRKNESLQTFYLNMTGVLTFIKKLQIISC